MFFGLSRFRFFFVVLFFLGAFLALAFFNHLVPVKSAESTAILPPVGATKVVGFPAGGDVDLDGRADPGDTLQYTVTITNGGTDANAVNLSDTIQNITTLVGGSVVASPIAADDTFSSIGNVGISVPAGSGVFANDLNPNGAGILTVQSSNQAGLQGLLSLNTTTGAFDFTPNPGFEGSTSFTYTLGNGTGLTDTATVTINVTGMIWFVNSALGVNGDGRLGAPFNSTANFNAGAADDAGDNVFLFSGTYNNTTLTLLNNQRVIGQGASDSILTITGLTLPTFSLALPATGGAAPTINSTVTPFTLGQNNTFRGLIINNAGASVNAKLKGTNFGTLTVGKFGAADVALSGTGKAMDLTTGAFAATSAFSSVATTSSGTHGMSMITVGGTVAFGSTAVSGSTNQGIFVNNSGVNLNFGNTTVGATTGSTECVRLEANSGGTRTFGSLGVTNCTAQGITISGGGNLIVTGQTTVTNPGSTGILISSTTVGTSSTFANTVVNDSGSTGVSLVSIAGSLTFADLDIDTDANVRAFQATNSTGTITTTSGTFADTGTATAVEITNASGTVPLNMTLTSVTANGGANGIILQNTSGTFSVVGDGTNTTQGGNSSGGTIANMSGTNGAVAGSAIYLNNAANVTLRRMTINGTNQNYGIRGFSVNNFTMEFSTIGGTNGNGNVTVDTEPVTLVGGEGSVRFTNLTGTASINGSILDGGFVRTVMLHNTSGTLGMTINNSIVRNTLTTLDTFDAYFMQGINASTMNLTVTNSTFPAYRQFAIQSDARDTATMAINISGSVFSNSNASAVPAAGSLSLGSSVSTDTLVQFDIQGNSFRHGAAGSGTAPTNGGAHLVCGTVSGAGKFDGKFINNTVGVTGVVSSGAGNGADALRMFASGNRAGTTRVTGTNETRYLVQGNTIKRYGEVGIQFNARQGNSVLNATVFGNTINEPGTAALGAFGAIWGNAGALPADTNVLNIVIGDKNVAGNRNTLTDSDPSNFSDITLDSFSSPGASINLYRNGSVAATREAVVLDINNPGMQVDPSSFTGVVNLVAGVPSPPSFTSLIEENHKTSRDNFDQNLSFLNTFYQSRSEFLTDVQPFATKSTTRNKEVIETAKTVETNEATTLSYSASIVEKFSQIFVGLIEAISPTVHAAENAGMANAPLSGETVTKALGTIPANEQVVVRFNVTVDNGPFAAGVNSITNTASISGLNFGTFNSNTSSILLDAAPDLSVTKTDGGATTQPSGTVTYTLNYQNATGNNLQNSTGVVLSETVPANTTFNAGASTAGWVCTPNNNAGSICNLTVGTLNAGANGSATFAVNVLGTLPAVSTVSNTSSIADDATNGTDLNPVNNSGSDTTPIIGVWLGGTSTDWFTASNWSNSIIPPSGNNVAIPNVANQPIIATGDVTLNNLVLNGENVTLNATRTLTVNGAVTLGSNNIDGAGTLVLGASANITRTSGQVSSGLNKTFNATGAFTYPMGTANGYSPVSVNITALAINPSSLEIKANDGIAPATPPLNNTMTLNRYWTLTETGDLTADVTFNYLQGDVNGTESNYRTIRVESLTAMGLPNGSPCPGAANPCVDTAANTIFVGGVGNFSDWTAGDFAPTAASVSVSGRVLTETGRSVFNAEVQFANSNGEVRRSRTNPFGYYRITELAAGENYVITVASKSYRFMPQVVSISEDSSEMNLYVFRE